MKLGNNYPELPTKGYLKKRLVTKAEIGRKGRDVRVAGPGYRGVSQLQEVPAERHEV